MNARTMLAIAFLAVLVGLLVGFFILFERVPTTVRTPPRGMAALHDYYAAELLLDELGVPARSAFELGPRAPADHAMFIWEGEREVSAAQAAELLRFVEEGGLLVLAPLEDDPTGARYDPELLDAIATAEPVDAGDGVGEHRVIGAGRLVLLEETAWATHEALGLEGNADRLWRLVNAHGPRDGVLFVVDWERPSLWSWAWGLARPLWIALLAWLAVGVWREAMAFGPLRPRPAPMRRSLLEHIDAAGRYLWTRGRRDTLADAMKAAIRARLARTHPRAAALDEHDLVALLATRTGRAAEEIRAVWEPPLEPDPAQALRRLRALQELERRT